MPDTRSASPRFDVSNKVVIVTGSGRGLGAEMARGLAAAGASVMICARTAADVEQTAAAIARDGGQAASTLVDTSDRASCQRLVDETVARFGRVDVLVNNAGIDIIDPAEEVPEETWDRIIDINLKGYFLCAQIAARQMFAQGTGGSIINISSICSSIAVPGLTAYSSAKGGVNQLARVMAVEWAQRGVRVNVVAPGYLDNVMRGTAGEHQNPEKQRHIVTFTPMARRGRPDEVVGPVIFFASDASSYVTGAVLYVDGGYTAL